MNTTEKGDILEAQSVNIVKRLVEDELIGVIKKYARIFVKKKYPSNIRRNGEVEFDLSIEIWPPNAKRYSMVYFIECKNYKSRIPIEKVKKFHADILETSGVNSKGIMISNSPFQKGAYDYADSLRMMLIEGETVDNFKIILHKRTKEVENSIPIVSKTENLTILDQGVKSLEKIIDKQILSSFLKANSNISYGIDKLSKKDIERIAQHQLNKINKRILKNAYGLSKDDLINFIKNEYGIKIKIIKAKKNKFLGVCDIENKIIKLDSSVIDTSRELFILAHEFGHFILHQKLSINQKLLDLFEDTEQNLISNKVFLDNPRQWIEWQANYFAACLTIPQSSLIAMLWMSQQRRGLLKGNLYLDDQKNTQRAFYSIIDYLSYHFNVSKTSIIYRLKEHELINDNSRTKTVGELIEQYKSMFFT